MACRAGATVVAAVTALTTIAGCGSSSPQHSAATEATETTAAPTTTARPTTTAAPTTTERPTARPTTTVPAPEPTPPTGPPVVTYSAEIDVLAPRAVAAPVRVQIPSIGADGLVAHVGVDAAGGLEVPDNAKTLVWYRYGPSPGQPGSAVIAGHFDWKGVRGTFNELAETPVGETVTVAYDDGSERAFTIRSVELVDKPAVSVNGTFARDGESVLRLVTCGGEFDRSAHSYYSNVVVTAVPA
jgi:Sortase domain